MSLRRVVVPSERLLAAKILLQNVKNFMMIKNVMTNKEKHQQRAVRSYILPEKSLATELTIIKAGS